MKKIIIYTLLALCLGLFASCKNIPLNGENAYLYTIAGKITNANDAGTILNIDTANSYAEMYWTSRDNSNFQDYEVIMHYQVTKNEVVYTNSFTIRKIDDNYSILPNYTNSSFGTISQSDASITFISGGPEDSYFRFNYSCPSDGIQSSEITFQMQ
mgnify:CR=1 FL=1